MIAGRFENDDFSSMRNKTAFEEDVIFTDLLRGNVHLPSILIDTLSGKLDWLPSADEVKEKYSMFEFEDTNHRVIKCHNREEVLCVFDDSMAVGKILRFHEEILYRER